MNLLDKMEMNLDTFQTDKVNTRFDFPARLNLEPFVKDDLAWRRGPEDAKVYDKTMEQVWTRRVAWSFRYPGTSRAWAWVGSSGLARPRRLPAPRQKGGLLSPGPLSPAFGTRRLGWEFG
ncbi:expressed unknown protein [Ectocarpus siliculosus]|uniref:Uncharacterized protein n=1 Tax=Ectocarpus siliculosus TaxID=2880 RepID=D7FQP5_ECTSI|nr:expressed unknown protein [Ectocarpus siliculosus]|eukprot:CBJ49152.1 expressed unknown protein [Ectocarpus siliculosus]